jgi:SAM-dependent methyltransferase
LLSPKGVGTYREDLAYVHHQGFSGFALETAPGILKILRGCGIDSGKVVELGCGTGVLARQLGFAGFEVFGIDASAEMLDLARATAPSATFKRESIVGARLPRTAAIICTGEVISFAFEADRTGIRLQRLLLRIWNALKPGGVFLFDFSTRGRTPAGMDKKSHWIGEDWAVLVETGVSDEEADVLARRLTTFRKIDGAYRRSFEEHRLRLYRPSELQATLASLGFVVQSLSGYGQWRFRSGHAGLLARKPA